MADGIEPPRGVAPAALWRLLLRKRPEQAIRHRLSMQPKVGLVVRAVPSLVLASANDDGALDPIPAMGRRHALREILAAVLYTADGLRAFRDGAELAKILRADEAVPLAADVLAALNTICPTFARIDVPRWRRTLLEGARADMGRASLVASCSDPITGLKELVWMPRPERFWGMPVAELLDGHHLAFQAAMTAVGKSK